MQEEIYELLAKYFNGDILNEEDKKLLSDWQSKSDANKRSFDKYQKMFNEREYLNEVDSINIDKAWKVQENRINKSRSLHINHLMRYAAIIIPIIGISLFWMISQNKTPLPSPKLVDLSTIEGGKHKALLTMGDGKTVNLTDVNQVIANTEGLSIKADSSGKLEYVSAKEAKASYNTLYVPRAGEYQLILPDGTKVWLNSDTKLIYPTVFTGKTRKVSLEGEAYFSVAKNKKKPFIVTSKNMNIKVLGTEFNFNSYDTRESIDVVLIEGSVRYKTGNKTDILKPGQKVSRYKTSGKVSASNVDVNKYIAWKEGIYMFDNISLGDLSEEISRWYDVEVFFVNQSIKDKLFTGVIEKYKSLKFIVELLESTNSVKCRLKEKILYIEEKR